MAEKTYEELRAEFAQKITPFKQSVAEEFLRRKNGYHEPTVVEGLSDEDKAFAQKLLAVQAKKGFFARQDLSQSDFFKIQATAKKYGISNKQAVARFITSDRYMSPETVETENLCNLIEDIFSVYGLHYGSIGAFPVNALSESSRAYLRNKKVALGLSDKLKIVLEEYLPELSQIKVVDKSYRAVPRPKKLKFNDAEVRAIAIELKNLYADENGNIDSIFSEKNKADLKKLLSALSERGISFEQFVTKNGLNYTRCYEVDSVPAVLRMIESYYTMFGTYQGITANDPFLRQKIDTVEKQEGIFNLSDFLLKYGIENDVFDNCQMINENELKLREKQALAKIEKLYPQGVIEEGFSKKNGELYEELLRIAKRRGFSSLDDYLASVNCSRIKNHDKRASSETIVLTEHDMFHYGLLRFGENPNFEEAIKQYRIKLADVERFRVYYQNLVAGKKETKKAEISDEKANQ